VEECIEALQVVRVRAATPGHQLTLWNRQKVRFYWRLAYIVTCSVVLHWKRGHWHIRVKLRAWSRWPLNPPLLYITKRR